MINFSFFIGETDLQTYAESKFENPRRGSLMHPPAVATTYAQKADVLFMMAVKLRAFQLWLFFL